MALQKIRIWVSIRVRVRVRGCALPCCKAGNLAKRRTRSLARVRARITARGRARITARIFRSIVQGLTKGATTTRVVQDLLELGTVVKTVVITVADIATTSGAAGEKGALDSS